jgi:hypothetical protein
MAIALFLLAFTGLLAGWLSFAAHPLAATLLTIGAMTLLLGATARVVQECPELRIGIVQKHIRS